MADEKRDEGMILGFTGTQRGTTVRQKQTVSALLRYGVNTLHLGDCVGADDEAYDIAASFGIALIGHPPNSDRRRAHRAYAEERPQKSYLERNNDIAREGIDGLIAAPSSFVEVLRSGTWATVRRAGKLGRRIWIVRPDGRVVEEAAR